MVPCLSTRVSVWGWALTRRTAARAQECLVLFKGPADIAVEEVHAILRQIVARTIAGEECKQLAQFTQLKREIATCAAVALEAMKEEARGMVLTLVEMERSYLTAEVFKEILAQNGRSEGGEVIRTLSGRQARARPARPPAPRPLRRAPLPRDDVLRGD